MVIIQMVGWTLVQRLKEIDLLESVYVKVLVVMIPRFGITMDQANDRVMLHRTKKKIL